MTTPRFWEEGGLDSSEEIKQKLESLKRILLSYGSILVAFSGGCDSAFLLKMAREVLGEENVKAVIAKSPSLPLTALYEAREIAREIDVSLIEIETHEIENPRYTANPLNRCYFCKSELYALLFPLAERFGLRVVANGSHRDDFRDWRPGLKAAEEYGAKSPLAEAGFGKDEIRQASREIGLSSWSKPQAACLSSRIPFGVPVSVERLKQIEAGEEILKKAGFRTIRLRWFGESAHIEVGAEETKTFFRSPQIRGKILKALRKIGFKTVTIDLRGYQPGRFNPQTVQTLS